jgi:hypothetical protein
MTTDGTFWIIIFTIIRLPSYQASNIFESTIRLTPLGRAFRARRSIELLNILVNVQSLTYCSMSCNQNPRCRTFDFDQSTRICRLFESELSTGTLLSNASLVSSRVGAVRYDTDRVIQTYKSLNRTCNESQLGYHRYLQCSSHRIECPSLTFWNGQKCTNQFYSGSQCNNSNDCRVDLNLMCSNQSHKCVRISGMNDEIPRIDMIA